MSTTSLPPINRFISTHDAEGNAIWDESTPVQLTGIHSGGFSTYPVWYNEDHSNSHAEDRDLQTYRDQSHEKELAPASGSTVRVIDISPGYPALMHRTATVDYGIVLEGEVECILDKGETRTMRRGDIIVQRGAIHAWRNSGTEVARLFCVMLPAAPVKVQGRELETHGFADLARLAQEGGSK